MTTQTQIIIFCGLGVLAIPLGVFVGIKTINKLTRPIENVLASNRGDIELVDYVQPSQPLNTYYPREFDLVNSQYSMYERISGVNPPTYYSGVNQSIAAPSYHTVDRNIINCCLENENIINQDIITWLITFLAISLIILKIIYKNHQIQSFCSLIPFSSFEIDFRDAFNWRLKWLKLYPQISYLKIQTLTKDLIDLLNSLAENENFSMGISYIPSYSDWKIKGVIPIYLQDPIIVNKESDPILISQFIMETLLNKGIISRDRIFDDNLINLIGPIILTVVVPIDVQIHP